MGTWIEKYVTGTPADNEAAERALDAVDQDKGDEFPHDLNDAAAAALAKLPPLRRGGWV